MNPTERNPNRAFKRAPGRSLTEVRETPVILVCIYNKNGTIITHDHLHTLFSSYGKILRILIFEKLQVWKAFVEYENVESAMQAKKNLDNFMLFNDGSRMNIYFSNLEVIRFQNDNDGGRDYTQNDPKYTQQSQSIQNFSNQQPQFDSNSMGGGSLMQLDSSTTMNQTQQKTTPVQTSRYPQRERIPFQRTQVRATTYMTSGLTQIDSGDEEPQDKIPMKMMARNYPGQFQMPQQTQFQPQQQPLFQQPFQQPQQDFQQFLQKQQFQPQQTQQMGAFLSEEQKINKPTTDFHINKFFNAEPTDPFQSNTLPIKKPPGIFPQGPQDSFFDLKPQPQEKPLISEDQEIFSDIMNKMNEGLGKFQITESYNNGQGFSNGDHKSQPSSFKEIPNAGFEQLLAKPNGMNDSDQNNERILNALYDHVEKDLFAYQQQEEQKQQQPSMQNFKFNPTQNYQEFTNPLFPELDKNFMNQSMDQLGNKSNFTDPMNVSTDMQNFNRPNSLTSLTSNPTSFQSTDPKFTGGQNFSPEGLYGVNFSQIPELQNFNPADLKDPAKLAQLYEKLSMLLGIDNSDIDTKKSPVLYVRGLEHPDFKIHMLYNIFSNFGNIRSIIYTRSKGSALLEFENSDQSTLSKEYLNNVTFMGKTIKIYYSNYEALQLHNKKNAKGQSSEEVFIGTEKSFRFKKSKSISINPPSPSLHISNLVKDACNEKIIMPLFERFGRVDAIRFLFMDNMKNMCLLRMGSTEESLNAMAFLHDYDLMGRKIQISFTRSKI